MLKNKEIANIFNKDVGSLVDNLGLDHWENHSLSWSKGFDMIINIIKRYKIIPTLNTAKENVAALAVSLFRQFLYDVRKDIWELKNNKVVGGEILVYILEGSKFTFDTLTNFINKSIESGCFPDSLKESNFTPIFEKEYPLDKYNYRPASILPLYSKNNKRLICKD